MKINIFPLKILVFFYVFNLTVSIPYSTVHANSGGRIFYVDAKSGSDAADGQSIKRCWKSLEPVNKTKFTPGDKILFRRGSSWTGQLHPQGSGIKNRPILLGAYGNGSSPLIEGNGIQNGALYLFNQQYWEISDLEITNYNASEQEGQTLREWEKSNRENFADAELPPQVVNKNTPKYGIFILGKDAGVLNHLIFRNLLVHGVNGYIDQADELSKENGGIVFRIEGERKPTFFDGILLDSCTVSDVDRTGILLCSSSWNQRTLKENKNWVPSKNIKILRCFFSRTGANALVVRVADRPVIERNLFDHCAIKASGNAGFSFNCDGAMWQYNECRFTKANIDDRDAGGIDSDYKTKNTVLQYNYIHDNDYGMLITGGPANFNDSTIVRYNIFENDGAYAHPTHKKCLIRISGSATNTMIYNNVFYLSPKFRDTKIVSHEVWKTSPVKTTYLNNIFYNLSKNAYCDFESSKENVFENNLYFGNPIIDLPNDFRAIHDDPGFLFSGTGASRFRIADSFPVIGMGLLIKNGVSLDYFGNPVSTITRPSPGVHEPLR